MTTGRINQIAATQRRRPGGRRRRRSPLSNSAGSQSFSLSFSPASASPPESTTRSPTPPFAAGPGIARFRKALYTRPTFSLQARTKLQAAELAGNAKTPLSQATLKTSDALAGSLACLCPCHSPCILHLQRCLNKTSAVVYCSFTPSHLRTLHPGLS